MTEGLLALAVEHFTQLALAQKAPDLPPELEGVDGARALHDHIMGLRAYIVLLCNGDISQEIPLRGFMAGLLKAHIANLRHLTWQVEQVSKGDFTQRVDFLGDFSAAFNNMVEQLDRTVRDLNATQESLTKLTKTLRQEVELRSAAVHALKQSKARFKYLADHDPLTGALNRRSFMHLAESGLKQAHVSEQPCCLAMLDVDHFKRFNDTYGHLDGDEALKQVVSLCAANLRQQDCLGRYGGEEFVFFFAEADLNIGRRVAERMLDAIREKPVRLERDNVPITASMGLCVILPEWQGRRGDAFLQKAIALADAALYRAKQEGRDRVVTAPPVNPMEADTAADAVGAQAKE